MSDLVQRLYEYEVTLHSAATLLPAPSAVTDGAALEVTTPGGRGYDADQSRDWALSVDFGTPGSSLTNGVLCALDSFGDSPADKWRAIAVLNEGLAITDDSGVGWEDTFRDLAAAGTRFCVKGALSAGTVTIKMRPLGVGRR